MLEKGMKAPDFSLADTEGRTWTLADFSGRTFVLYFYPRDDTPGCTVEACSFRDGYGELRAKGVEVVGVSPDKAESHAKFAKKYGLPFLLLSDPERTALEAYGAYGEKMMYGKVVKGVIRSTFVIGPDGVLKAVFPKVTPKDHAKEILAVV